MKKTFDNFELNLIQIILLYWLVSNLTPCKQSTKKFTSSSLNDEPFSPIHMISLDFD